MGDSSVKSWTARVRQAALTLLAIAVAARIAWSLLAPLVPILVSFVVVVVVISIAVFGWHRK